MGDMYEKMNNRMERSSNMLTLRDYSSFKAFFDTHRERLDAFNTRDLSTFDSENNKASSTQQESIHFMAYLQQREREGINHIENKEENKEGKEEEDLCLYLDPKHFSWHNMVSLVDFF